MRLPNRKYPQKIKQEFDPYITADKYQGLKAKLERLINQDRPQTAQEVADLALDGDFSENAGYQAVKAKLRTINSNILRIQNILKNAKIIKADQKTNYIQVGSLFTVKVNGKVKQLQILGGSEADPVQSIISRNSPVGLALLGQPANTKVMVKTNGREIVYEIMSLD
ncbi:MAG: GreA/GreB family elongation factor [bacterium]